MLDTRRDSGELGHTKQRRFLENKVIPMPLKEEMKRGDSDLFYPYILVFIFRFFFGVGKSQSHPPYPR
jgi:hypothetical protein